MKKALFLLAFIISIGTIQPALADWTEWRLPASKEAENQNNNALAISETAQERTSIDYSQWTLPAENHTIPTELEKNPLERLKAALSNLILTARTAPFNFAKDAYQGYKNPETCSKEQRIAYEKLVHGVYVATALSCVTITSLNLVSILRKVLATQAEQARRVAQETRARAAREMVENRRRVLERLAEEELQQAIDASLAQEQPSAPIVQASNPQITAVQNSCRTFLGNRSDQKNDECTLCNEITTVNLYPCKNIHTGYICAGCITNLHDKCALCRERLFTR